MSAIAEITDLGPQPLLQAWGSQARDERLAKRQPAIDALKAAHRGCYEVVIMPTDDPQDHYSVGQLQAEHLLDAIEYHLEPADEELLWALVSSAPESFLKVFDEAFAEWADDAATYWSPEDAGKYL